MSVNIASKAYFMNFDVLKLKRSGGVSGASVLSRSVGILGLYHFKNLRKLPVS